MPGVNRYDRAPQRLYISQYVPIPFDELYKIGTANNEATEKALENLTTNMNKWAEFYSPSLVDMKNWYDLTVGQGSQIANELASNPDLIKTPEGRSRILSFINNRPYYLLSLLKHGAEALNERKKSEADLMKANRYNPAYHAFDYTNYNTLENGVLNLTSLLPWYTMPEIVAPYVNQLKDQDLGSRGGYDYTGVSRLMVEDQINKYRSDILQNPSIQMQIDDLVNNFDLSREDAENAVMTDAVTAAYQYVRLHRTPNQYTLADYTARVNGKGPYNPQNNNMPTDVLVFRDSMTKKLNNEIANYTEENGTNGSQTISLSDLINYKILKNAVNNPGFKSYMAAFLDIGQTYNQSNASLFVYSLIGAKENKNVNSSFKNNYVLSDTDGLMPFARLANLFSNSTNNPALGLENEVTLVKSALSKLGEVYISGSPTVVPNGDNNAIVSFDIIVPVLNAASAGLTEDNVKKVGGTVSYAGTDIVSETNRDAASKKSSEKDGTVTRSQSTTVKEGQTEYYKIPVIKEIEFNAFDTLGANANAWNKSSAVSKERSSNVGYSYNSDITNISE